MNKMGHCLNPRLVTGCYTQIVCMGTELCPTLCDPMDCSPPGSLSKEFSSKNTGVGSHFLLQGIFPNPGTELMSVVSPAVGGGFFFFLPVKLLGKPYTQETD